MAAGLEDITEGQIAIGGEVVNDLSPKQRDIAMIFQNYALYPHMTVYDDMAFGLQLRREKKAEIDRRVREAASTLGLTEYATIEFYLDTKELHFFDPETHLAIDDAKVVSRKRVLLSP
jgi:ABC-type sugar transport system ATPase subunit